MTANFDSHNSDPQSSAAQNPSKQALDMMQRDRFELLSAYMDGEVSADERRQVEDWLEHDPTVQRLHARLLKLRQAFQTMPVPISDDRAVQQTVDAVLARVDRRPPLARLWGGIAIAAVAVGAMTVAFVGGNPFEQQMARQAPEVPATVQEEPLLVALDKPLVSIPETETTTPKRPSPLTNPNNTIR
jgi:anti-sigma factor RsiW